MKHLYLLICMMFCGILQSQIINFPDANFKAKLLQSNANNMIAYDSNENSIALDVNGNGEIEVAEVQNVYGLNIMNAGIADLTGISSFVNLKGLNCSNNSLTSLSIANTINLLYLTASHNALSSINVNFEDEVYSLDLSYNNLTSFAADSSFYRDSFNLSHNQLSSLTLNNTWIENSNFSYNNLAQVQSVGNVGMYGYGDFSHNQFSLLNLSNLYFANHFVIRLGFNPQDAVWFDASIQPSNIEYSSDNTVFDLGNFNRSTDCDPEYTGNVTISNSPNLQLVILKNGYYHTNHTCNEGGTVFQIPSINLQITNCPTLNQLCVDANEQSDIQARINQLGLQSQVQVNSNCSSSILNVANFEAQDQFVIYPIPTKELLHIDSKSNLEIDSLSIYNNLGQSLYQESGGAQNVDVSFLPKGSYILTILSGTTTFSKQLLKQ